MSVQVGVVSFQPGQSKLSGQIYWVQLAPAHTPPCLPSPYLELAPSEAIMSVTKSARSPQVATTVNLDHPESAKKVQSQDPSPVNGSSSESSRKTKGIT